jgi:hypothetical protein
MIEYREDRSICAQRLAQHFVEQERGETGMPKHVEMTDALFKAAL